ncbi:DMT family transporter [Paenibacillus sp. P26]|nr:DMT family transporter [Paenibacillus sp. P26]
MLYLLCAFSLAGTSVIAVRFVNGGMGTFTITAVSLMIALLCLLPFCWKALAETVRLSTLKDWMLLAFQALFGIVLFRMFLLYGLVHTSAGEAGIITGATPAVTVLLAKLLLGETVDGAKLAGILSTIAGIVLIQGLIAEGSPFSMNHLGGNALVLCAAACESLFNVISRTAAVRSASSRRATMQPMVQTTLVTAIAGGFAHSRRSVSIRWPRSPPWDGKGGSRWYGTGRSSRHWPLFAGMPASNGTPCRRRRHSPG